MSGTRPGDAQQAEATRHIRIALIGSLGFCILSSLGYLTSLGTQLMVLAGLALPLVWGWRTGEWEAMGFSRRNLGAALAWGVAGGLVTSAIGIAVVREWMVPERLGLELAVGIPLWLLVASPFQEFFFRGWLQTRWERGVGKGLGLVVATVVFTLWHFCWPLAGQTAVPLFTLQGVLATFISGLVYGFCFQRAGSIVAPWLAHAMAGVAFLCIGAGSFVGALP
jgi:membrane protease YdiL (CAAX protease family)